MANHAFTADEISALENMLYSASVHYWDRADCFDAGLFSDLDQSYLDVLNLRNGHVFPDSVIVGNTYLARTNSVKAMATALDQCSGAAIVSRTTVYKAHAAGLFSDQDVRDAYAALLR